MAFDVLLENPFLDEHGSVIDCRTQMLYVGDSEGIPFAQPPRGSEEMVAAVQKARNAERAVTMLLQKRMVIKPWGTTPIPVVLSDPTKTKEVGTVKRLQVPGCLLIKEGILDLDHQGKGDYSIFNTTLKPITLDRRTPLGIYTQIKDPNKYHYEELSDKSIFEQMSGPFKNPEIAEKDGLAEDDTHHAAFEHMAMSGAAHVLLDDLEPEEDMKIAEEVIKVPDSLETKLRKKLKKKLTAYPKLWGVALENKIQHVKGVEHSINTGDATPIRSKLRRRTMVEGSIIEEHVDKMDKRGVIRRSRSPWASPVLLADKKSGKVRFCVDYRRMNNITKKDAYPLPNIQEILDKMGGNSFYTTIDLRDAFWSIRIREEDIEKSAFITHKGLWEFVSMPFGLSNAPATQQRFIETVLAGLSWECCMAYVDDIVIFSKTFDEHMEHLGQVLQRLDEHELRIAPEKCSFCHPTFEMLGHICSKEGVAPNPAKTDAIREYPQPNTKEELVRFLGVVAWVRRFILNCSKITAPLRKLATEGPKMLAGLWKENHDHAFNELKERLMEAPILSYPDFTKEFFIHVDASGVGLGAILTQQDDKGRHRIVAYASTALKPTQEPYPPTWKECYGVLWAIQHFRHYIHGTDFTIYTDHKPLVPALMHSISSVRMIRDWTARIMEENPKLVHRPGKLMVIPDALSRVHYAMYTKETQQEGEDQHIMGTACAIDHADLGEHLEQAEPIEYLKVMSQIGRGPQSDEGPEIPDVRTYGTSGTQDHLNTPTDIKRRGGTYKTPIITNIGQVPIRVACINHSTEGESGQEIQTDITRVTSLEALAVAQRQDPTCRSLLEYKVMGKVPNDPRMGKMVMDHHHKFAVDVLGVLRRTDAPSRESGISPIVIPDSLEKSIIQWCHKDPLSGHLKFDKTYARIKDRYWFPGMHLKVYKYCTACRTCLLKDVPPQPKPALQTIYAEGPLSMVHADVTKGSGKTTRGHTHILTVIDRFTGYIKTYPLKGMTARTIADELFDYVCMFGVPVTFKLDNGSEFLKETDALLKKYLNSNVSRIAPKNPQANSKVERWHRTLKSMMRGFIDKNHTNWDVLLPMLQFAINTAKNRITRYSPHFLFFGRQPRLPIEVPPSEPKTTLRAEEEYVHTIQTNMEQVYDYVRSKMRGYYEKMQENDEGVREPLYQEGDWVRRLKESTADGLNTKYMDPFYPIPYEVFRSISPTTVILRDTESGKVDETPRSVNHIRPWTGERKLIPTPTLLKGKQAKQAESHTHQVSEILAKRVTNQGEIEYQVRYTGYGTRSRSRHQWLKEHEILNKELIKIFDRANPQNE